LQLTADGETSEGGLLPYAAFPSLRVPLDGELDVALNTESTEFAQELACDVRPVNGLRSFFIVLADGYAVGAA
jgi:hypothetical protein